MSSPAEGLPDPPDNSPHKTVQIFYSKNIEPVIADATLPTLPKGTVAIKKQDRDGDGTFDQYMVMIKGEKGSDPAAGDWEFAQYKPSDGTLVTSSKDDAGFKDFCTGCHKAFTDTDWLRGTGLSN